MDVNRPNKPTHVLLKERFKTGLSFRQQPKYHGTSSSFIKRPRVKSHYSDVIMSAMVSQIVSIVYSTVCSGADQRKHQAPRHWPLGGEYTADKNVKLFLHYVWCLHTEMAQIIETLPHEEQGIDYHINAIAADGLATQGARAKSSRGIDRVHHQKSHYGDVTINAMVSQITGASIVCLIVCLGALQRRHQSSTSLAVVRANTSDRWIPFTTGQYCRNVSIW